MKKRMVMLIAAAVAVTLPAVAVADVMVSTNVGVAGSQNTSNISVVWGLNYKSAHSVGAITYLPPSNGTGTVNLAGMSNANTSMVNVLTVMVNLTSNVTNGNVWVNFTSGSFPSNALVLVSNDYTSGPATFQMLQSNGQPLNNASFHFNVNSTANLDVSFFLPAGHYGSSDHANMGIMFKAG